MNESTIGWILAGTGAIFLAISLIRSLIQKKNTIPPTATPLNSEEYEKLIKRFINQEEVDRLFNQKLLNLETDLIGMKTRFNSLQGLVNRKMGKLEEEGQEEASKPVNYGPDFLSVK